MSNPFDDLFVQEYQSPVQPQIQPQPTIADFIALFNRIKTKATMADIKIFEAQTPFFLEYYHSNKDICLKIYEFKEFVAKIKMNIIRIHEDRFLNEPSHPINNIPNRNLNQSFQSYQHQPSNNPFSDNYQSPNNQTFDFGQSITENPQNNLTYFLDERKIPQAQNNLNISAINNEKPAQDIQHILEKLDSQSEQETHYQKNSNLQTNVPHQVLNQGNELSLTNKSSNILDMTKKSMTEQQNESTIISDLTKKPTTIQENESTIIPNPTKNSITEQLNESTIIPSMTPSYQLKINSQNNKEDHKQPNYEGNNKQSSEEEENEDDDEDSEDNNNFRPEKMQEIKIADQKNEEEENNRRIQQELELQENIKKRDLEDESSFLAELYKKEIYVFEPIEKSEALHKHKERMQKYSELELEDMVSNIQST